MKTISISFLLLAFLATGCYYDKEEELYPGNGNCTTTDVSYSVTVSNLLSSYGCIGCHSGTAPSGSINLQGYNNVKARVNDGKLMGSINHAPGFSAMPQGGNKMNSCDIAKIKAWIDAGAPNN